MRACVLEKEGLGLGDAFVCVCVFGKEWGNFLGSGLLAFYIDAGFLVGSFPRGKFCWVQFSRRKLYQGTVLQVVNFPRIVLINLKK